MGRACLARLVGVGPVAGSLPDSQWGKRMCKRQGLRDVLLTSSRQCGVQAGGA